MRRVQFADGRTRAFVNDQPVSVQVLRALGAALVEIHGQHDERAFVDAATHRALLDAYGGIEDDAAEVARLWTERRAREAAVESHRAAIERAGREAEWLRHAVDELGRLRPADRRGDCARRAPHRHDAGGKSRRRFARHARGRHRAELSGAAAGDRGAPAGAARRAGAGADRAGGQGDRRRADRAGRGPGAARSRRCRSPNSIRPSSSGSRSGCSRCAPPGANTMCRSTSLPRSPAATKAISR